MNGTTGSNSADISYESPFTRRQIVIGAILALLSAVIGCVTSLHRLDVNKAKLPTFPVLDRRAAEQGRIPVSPSSSYHPLRSYAPRVSKQYHAYDAPPGGRAPNTAGRSILPPSLADKSKSDSNTLASALFPRAFGPRTAAKLRQPNQADPTAAQQTTKATHASTAFSNIRRSAPAKRVPTTKATPQHESTPEPAPPEAAPAAEEETSKLHYPATLASRSVTMSSDSVWENCRNHWSPILDREENMIGSTTFVSPSAQLYVESGRSSTETDSDVFLQSDTDINANSLGLHTFFASNGTRSILAPVGVTRHERLISSNNIPDKHHYSTAVVREVTSTGTFFLRSPAERESFGGAVFNHRAELAGIIVGRLRGYPGHDYTLAADSSVINGILHSPELVNGALYNTQEVIAAALLRDVKVVHEFRTPLKLPLRRNSRVSPGYSMGNFQIGSTIQEIRTILGRGRVIDTGETCSELIYEDYHLSFTIVDGLVACITTNDPSYATAQGVGVGTRWVEVRKSSALTNVALGPLAGGFSIVVGHGLELELSKNGKVVQMRVTPP